MAMQTIKKEITVNAPKEAVWQVLLNDEFTRQWYEAFSPGSHAETDWRVGSKAVFTDNTGCGLISRVVENKPGEVLAMEFEGAINNGVEDYDSDMAKAMKGGKEIYRLSEETGRTHLSIAADMDENYFEMMSAAWDKALEQLRALAEKAPRELETAI
ncbi:MAG TPA: SRPBCC domain-containing protein [Flavisolibacter sp.]|nr:SRPBCC domain-containing protein [Flavisolibacter sp.]